MAKQAVEDTFRYFWTEEDGGHFTKNCELVLWELGMAVLMLESYYDATQDPEIPKRMEQEWRYLQKIFADPHDMTAPDSACNPACDDAAWSAMVFMTLYRMTKDPKTLDLASETIRRSYDYWKDGDLKNGIWYRFGEDRTPKEYSWVKSVYCAGLMLSALEHYEVTKGTAKEDRSLLEDTLALYEWVERDLRRDGRKTFRTETESIITDCHDQFYYVEFVDNKETGRWAPRSIENPQYIGEAGSCSSLFGNTGMAAINIKLYQMFGDEKYRARALATANSLVHSPYNDNGVLVNDRDAWTNAAFMRYFVELVLPQEGIDPQLRELVRNTGIQVAKRCRTAEGCYRPEWSGSDRWTGYPNAHTQSDQLKTSATSVHMIVAAALADSLGL